MKGTYYIEVRDKQGKLLKRIRHKSHSFVQQWNELVSVQVGLKEHLSIKDISGTDRDIGYNVNNLRMDAEAADGSYGALVGRGSTAVTISDYKLETVCAQGTGENQLEYLVCTIGDPSVVGPDCSFTVRRSAINNSGAAITVTEIGLIMIGYYSGVAAWLLAVRDVLASSIEIPDGGCITVTYTLKVTV